MGMRRRGRGIGLVVIAAAVVALAAGSTSAAGSKKLVEGTVYDTTCATACLPECPPPPHCGPITQAAREKVVCAQPQQRMIVCPLAGSPRICLPSSNCGGYPVYSGDGAVVNVRKRGSATVLATLPVVEGHFKIRLPAGEYILHPYLPEEPCWSGKTAMVQLTARLRSPVPATVDVSNGCVAHPDASGEQERWCWSAGRVAR
jgi:hypothetical protein